MPDRISNYRQVRLILNPWEGVWSRAYWSVHFLTVRQGIPRDQIADDGLIMLGTDTPTQEDFWASLAAICSAKAATRQS